MAKTLRIGVRGENLKILTIGDSHAIHFHSFLKRSYSKNKNILFWLGPKLMYSVARNGFGLTRLQQGILRAWGPDLCFIWLGEIDVRMHLVKHRESGIDHLDWLNDFLEQVVDLGKITQSAEVILFSPIPQSDRKKQDDQFPWYGSIQERVVAQTNLVQKIKGLQSQSEFCFHFFDITELLQGPKGSLQLQYSDDFCHLNHKGFEKIKEVWAKYLD